MKNSVKQVSVEEIKSKWFDDIFSEWQPEPDFIAYLIKQVKEGEYMAPIVVVRESGIYYIVNGHHRYYAQVKAGKKRIKCILLDGTFEASEPLRKAEVLLKEFDQKTEYKYQFSGYLDRWAAAQEEHHFINKYRPTYKFRLARFLKKLLGKT